MSIPTADLRALVAKWHERFRVATSIRDRSIIQQCADELDALIVKAEAQVGDAERVIEFLRTRPTAYFSRYDAEHEPYDGTVQEDCVNFDGIFLVKDLAAALGASPAPPPSERREHLDALVRESEEAGLYDLPSICGAAPPKEGE